jgi:hypothetical protein
MYKGLFGDLPSAKKDSGASKDEESKKESIEKPKNEQTSEIREVAIPDSGSSNNAKDTAKPTFVVPRFMPQQMKRPRKNHHVVTVKKQQLKQQESKNNEAATRSPHKHVKEDLSNPNHSIDPMNQSATKIVSAGPGEPYNVLNDEDRIIAPPPTKDKAIEELEIAGGKPFKPSSDSIVEEEPEYLRELHEQGKNDLYDPMVPNDVLHYWEHQRAAQEKVRLMQERDLALREHERMRQELDAERQRLQAEGDLDRLVQHRMEHHQGRNVSNVPAWLLEQQRAQREATNSSGVSE